MNKQALSALKISSDNLIRFLLVAWLICNKVLRFIALDFPNANIQVVDYADDDDNNDDDNDDDDDDDE